MINALIYMQGTERKERFVDAKFPKSVVFYDLQGYIPLVSATKRMYPRGNSSQILLIFGSEWLYFISPPGRQLLLMSGSGRLELPRCGPVPV